MQITKKPAFLWGSTILTPIGMSLSIALAQPVMAQQAPAAPASATDSQQIRSIVVVGSQRLEGDTVRSYIQLREGQNWSQVAADQAIKDLFATELFADVSIQNNAGAVVIEVKENPVVNRIILEGNKRVKNDKIQPEIRLAPRQIFSRSKVRADVARIIELYKRQGRFAANVEPKLVQLDQNRVDVVFEIEEGPKSKVRQINIIGNEKFSDGELRGQMLTKQARWTKLLSSGTSYDPDRLAFDQQKLRQFYLTEGYVDFRVVSAVTELTPDKKDFIITYVVEEGDKYKFGDVTVESQIRDFKSEALSANLPMKKGEWYNAQEVEDTVESLSESAGLFGYAFADVRPQFDRNKDDLVMNVTFTLAETPRVYVERIDINGNTQTKDKVLRREFRLNEGDAFNSFLVKRSADRIKSLGYFQEDFEVEQVDGSAPDRIVLVANVEEKPTGELSLSAGFSSLESFIFQGSIRQKNFRGMGQELGLSMSYSSLSKSAQLSFTEPSLFDRSIAVSGSIFRQDYDNGYGTSSNTTYSQTTTGLSISAGTPINEFLLFQARYSLSYDEVSLSDIFFYDPDGTGPLPSECDTYQVGRFLCEAVGKRTTSLLGYTFLYDTRDSRLRPTRGYSLSLSQDFAGLGGSVKYVKTRFNADKYWRLTKSGFIFSLKGEGGYIHPLENRGTDANGIDDVRLTDRFYLGEPQIRGFDIRGVGPRVIRYIDVDMTDPSSPVVNRELGRNSINFDDAIGGRAYYLGRAELEIPLGTGASELGLRPSLFMDIGSVFNIRKPILTTLSDFLDSSDGNYKSLCQSSTGTTFATRVTPTDGSAATGAFNICASDARVITPREEVFFGDSISPRLSVGFGVNWNSPFGPFRIDIAHALLKKEGDDTKLFSFNVGTQF
ncbi:outer membrane protein assembly factor BamA [Sphingorhabdus lutea]|uniref:Outer membrane protein assembly factor BamA n=1 Tax=Sphingorhabdus lutea TaxID=1913578 RepID=A0A1L3JF35_9SPHN|nr:outer membrane protein assembly factor BamA [Sphingorhabdus lutea]APG63745.1 outer membrane protein assembly factor BamA [Sphingorhabdus lutea]